MLFNVNFYGTYLFTATLCRLAKPCLYCQCFLQSATLLRVPPSKFSLLRVLAITCHLSSLRAATLAFLSPPFNRSTLSSTSSTSRWDSAHVNCCLFVSISSFEIVTFVQLRPRLLLAHAGTRGWITSELYLDFQIERTLLECHSAGMLLILLASIFSMVLSFP